MDVGLLDVALHIGVSQVIIDLCLILANGCAEGPICNRRYNWELLFTGKSGFQLTEVLRNNQGYAQSQDDRDRETSFFFIASPPKRLGLGSGCDG